MPNEASKALMRRLRDPLFASTYFIGEALDVGAGGDGLSIQRHHWPLLTHVREWDMPDGDGQTLATLADDTFDVVHSSHFLEHARDPLEALRHQVRVCKPGGHIVALIPDEDMYEQGVFPSTFNGDHKTTWTTFKARSWSPVSQSAVILVASLGDVVELLKAEKIQEGYDWTAPRIDQTGGSAACAIELVLRKRHAKEILFGGRVGAAR